MHWYKMHIGDYLSHTAHLDEMEDLAYRRMLDIYYQREEPFPEDVEEVARLIRMRSHCDRIAIVLREFFYQDDTGHWRHARIDEEIAQAVDKSEKARRSALKRHGKGADADDTQCDRNANAERTQSDRNATQDPRPKTQDPEEITQLSELFGRWWSAYPTKKSKKTAKAKFLRILSAKPEEEREAFVDRLIDDAKKRLALGQLGFDKLHPTTYLNQERWDDDYSGGDSETGKPRQGGSASSKRERIGAATADPYGQF